MNQSRPAGLPFPAPRRHSTVPTSFQPSQGRPSSDPVTTNGSVETLYSHPAVKIVAFTAGRSFFNAGPGVDEKPGTLASSSQFERTIAVGAFQIYRAPGSVAFLRCGSALQPILPKSQCWCIDEQSSKFVLQIRRPNYWRIEVPVTGDEDIRRALVLREILDKVMQFEKTPCPFERSFTVALPERPVTPVKKRPWTPPVRQMSLNWPPAPTPSSPPDFSTRPRLSSAATRRFSDFGVHNSQTVNVPSIPPPTRKTVEHVVERKGETKVEQVDAPAEVLQEQPESKATVQRAGHETNYEEPEASRKKTRTDDKVIVNLTEQVDPVHPVGQSAKFSTAQPLKEDVCPLDRTKSRISEPRKPDMLRPTKTRAAPPLSVAKDVHIQNTQREKSQISKGIQKLQSSRLTPATSLRVVKDARTYTKEEPEANKVNARDTPKETSKKPQNDANDEGVIEGRALEGSGQVSVRRGRLTAFASRSTSRRIMSAPQLSVMTSAPSRSPSPFTSVIEETDEDLAEPGSPAESQDSFHSIQSWRSAAAPLPPSPPLSPSETFPFPHENIPTARRTSHEVDASASTLTTPRGWDVSSGSGTHTPNTEPPVSAGIKEETTQEEDIQTETTKLPVNDAKGVTQQVPIPTKASEASDSESLSSSWSSCASTSGAKIRHRATTSVSNSFHNRALSPLPPAANLFSPPRRPYDMIQYEVPSAASTAVQTIRRVPSAIFNKTCEILLAPPSHIINLMLKVAARIAAGEWRGFVFGMTEAGEVVDVRWDWSDTEGALEGWEEGNFDWGAPSHTSTQNQSKAAPRGSFADRSRPTGKVMEYKDPWGTPSDSEVTSDDWSRSWEVD